MHYSDITERLSSLGGDKWQIFQSAKDRIDKGEKIIELCIGEPDTPTPQNLIDKACDSMQAGRTLYSNGRGEPLLRQELAKKYSNHTDFPVSENQILCFPGTQTALFAVFMGIAEKGCEIILGNPMYATYEGVIRAANATPVFVPLRPTRDFRIDPKDIEQVITEHTTAIFLNSPHNPTGAILTMEDLKAIADIAIQHDLWIISDEVYEEFVYPGETFYSPLTIPDIRDRTIIVSSISKSHAAPGFRSGWCMGPEAFCNRLLPLAEIMLFGNQPFIADMTTLAVSEPSKTAREMTDRFSKRAQKLQDALHHQTRLDVHLPKAGMFTLINVQTGYGLSGDQFAQRLLDEAGVAVMPGSAFGTELDGWIRLSLTKSDADIDQAIQRIIDFTNRL